MRASSRGKPRPLVLLAWGSQSMRRVLRPSRARAAARLMAVVVLPTPPFWLTTAMTLEGRDGVAGSADFASSFVGGWRVIIVVKEGYREVGAEAMAEGL